MTFQPFDHTDFGGSVTVAPVIPKLEMSRPYPTLVTIPPWGILLHLVGFVVNAWEIADSGSKRLEDQRDGLGREYAWRQIAMDEDLCCRTNEYCPECEQSERIGEASR